MENAKPKIIVAHPGRQHSFRVATALCHYSMLEKYVTTVYDKDSSKLMKVAKLFLHGDELNRAKKRKCPDVEDDKVLQLCEFGGLINLLLIRLDKKQTTQRKFSDQLSVRFQKKLAKYIIKNNATIPMSFRKNIILQLLRAYGYLHSKSIYHRDISPKNVLLKFYDDVVVVKISDFGLVKIEESDLTSENTDFKGSLNDPALKVEGFGNYGLLHEIYAITLLFAYILTGKSNWAKITDPTIKSFISKGTNPDKSKRFQTLDELGDAVKQYFATME